MKFKIFLEGLCILKMSSNGILCEINAMEKTMCCVPYFYVASASSFTRMIPRENFLGMKVVYVLLKLQTIYVPNVI